MEPIYLYIKTHNKTGLKYFGKTEKKDPFKYLGSGKLWRQHLSKFGEDITTEIFGCFYDRDECYKAAVEFSHKNNIVESTDWANLRIEELDGGDTSKTEGFLNALPKTREYLKRLKWWNNGVEQSFSEFPPNDTYVRGRLAFNNVGSRIGAEKNKGTFWVNNGIDEVMSTSIPEGYVKGRLKEKAFAGGNGRHSAKGTKWWNNGTQECMSITPPDDSYSRGRLKTQ